MLIFDWLVQTPALLATLAVLMLPGAAALRLVGVRGLALVACAPLFTVAATALSAIVMSAVGIAWSPVSWAVVMAVLVAFAALAGRLLTPRPMPRDSAEIRGLFITALIAGAVLITWRLVAYIGAPDAISQTNDAVFHMNAVRYVVETADASSLTISGVVSSTGFYPAAWHAVVALVVQATGASIPIAVNMLTVVIGAVVWPTGLAWLSLRATGSPTIAAYTAVLSGVMQNFPLLLFQWGVLFPNALSTALIPAGIAVVISLPIWHDVAAPWRSRIRAVLFVGIVVAALALAQPSALLPWAAICMVWATFRDGFSGRRVGGWVWIITGWVALAVAWWFLSRSTSGSHWPFFRSRFEAIVDVFVNSQVLIAPQILISVLMVVGIVIAVLRPSQRWVVMVWIGLSALYWLIATVGQEWVRDLLLGAWYADPYRIAALAPIAVVPLAAIGVDWLVRRVGRERERVAVFSALTALAVLVLIVVIWKPSPMPSITAGSYEERSRYESSKDGYLTPEERAMLEELDTLVEPGSRVLANPSTGAGFGYFFSGVDVFPRNWAPPSTDAWNILADDLRDVATDAAVCDALAVYGDPAYVLDFGPGEDRAGRWVMPGMTDFTGRAGFELVATEGTVSLWRITACAL